MSSDRSVRGSPPQILSAECRADLMGEWPESGLDIESAILAHWQPVPIREYVIKLVSGCNLACDHCYVYTMADTSWRSRPALMPRATIARTSARIAQHGAHHKMRRVRVVLHGGEPLLAGTDQLDYTARVLRMQLDPSVALEITIQTNGTLLTEEFMKVLHSHQMKVGVSIDGREAQHDRHRRYASGRGSYALAAAAINLLNKPSHKELFGGLLCTIDLRNDPLEVYAALLEFTPPVIDFLLPHGTWSSPPPGRDDSAATPYADWLSSIFDKWYFAARQETRIRLFEEIINLLLGGHSTSDQVGLSPADYLVVDADGSLQLTDALKAAYPGAPETGLNVFDNTIDQALRHPAVLARQLGLAALADKCQRCAIVSACGGGHYPHRYRRGSGFLNPSVYCPDLIRLIAHISRQLRSSSPG